eukprot:TRINITY_DN16153_c0_g2_i1.p1 TRINITY_DN16153_c0_g2~~TRINITY_DN16153_c0_g2_i1.p1  ORF type:complete len:472 (+),score=67.68 TRINITY_DN16153_c0_g2_i1:111-1526(+)
MCIRDSHLGLPALVVALIAVACAPTLWTFVPLLLAGITSLAWVLLQWMVPRIDWVTQNPFSEPRCGKQLPTDPVRFVWVDTATGHRLPLLHVQEPPQHESRRATGAAMGRKLAPFAHDVRWALWVFSVVLGVVVPDDLLSAVMDALPGEYLQELEGYVEGLSAELPHGSFLRSWTVRDLCRLQMLPDLKMLLSAQNPKQSLARRTLSRLAARKDAIGSVVGCSALLNHLGFYRNMDWLSLGVLGTSTLLVRRVYPSGAVTIEVGVPMLLGTVTSVVDMNDGSARTMIAMNVTNPSNEFKWPTMNKLPSSYYNRVLTTMVAQHGADPFTASPALPPLGPYHLTIGRGTPSGFQGQVTHFYQGALAAEHVTRTLTKELSFVLTCNGNYEDRVCEQAGSYLVRARNAMHTNERTEMIRKSRLADCDGLGALQLELVNNFETVYAITLEANVCLLYTSDAADEEDSVDLGGRRLI